MMKCLYLLSVVFHVAAGCDLSDNKHVEITGYKGDSVLLPCSCSDLNTKPQTLTWWTYRTGPATEVFNDEHYRDRLHLFNNTSPGNLSLLISDLREEDGVDYRCRTEKDYRDITLKVKVGRRETSTRSEKTDTTPPSEPTQSKTTNSPPASSSSLKQDEKQTHSSPNKDYTTGTAEDQGLDTCSVQNDERYFRLCVKERTETSTSSGNTDTTPPSEQTQSKTTNSPPASSSTMSSTISSKPPQTDSSLHAVFGILAVLLLVIPAVVAFICWRRKGGRCGEKVITEERPDYKRKQNDQTVPDVTYSTVTHINTGGAAQVQIRAGQRSEYATILTN